MDYESQLRSMFLRYPPRMPEVKIYIDPSISGCDKGWISGLGHENFKEVDTPEEADFIPVWLDYRERCSESIWNVVEQFPEKCLHSINLIESVGAEMPDIDDNTLQDIQRLLASPDWESLYLGLNMLRTFYLTDEAKNCARMVIDSLQRNPMQNNSTIVPFGKESKDAIVIGDIDIIRFFYVWLHNEYIQ